MSTPNADARWYCVSRDGRATLCKDEADAREIAMQCDRSWPLGRPHRAALLGDVAAEREQCPAPRWWHCDTHGPGSRTAWGCPECVREMRVSLSRARGLLIEIDSVLRMAESRGGGQLTAAAVRAAVEPYLPLDAGPNG